jgi:hypothetical protein
MRGEFEKESCGSFGRELLEEMFGLDVEGEGDGATAWA